MSGSPVIAAWVAGGLIWVGALVGLGAMGEPVPFDTDRFVAEQPLTMGADDLSDAYERALDGDAWGDEELRYQGGYHTAASPDS